MLKIGILTYFRNLTPAYSLVNVVGCHIEMLLEHGYEVWLMVNENCIKTDAPQIYKDPRVHYIELVDHYNNKEIEWLDYYDPSTKRPPDFDRQLETLCTNLYEALKDFNLCFMHDIHYLPCHAIHYMALQKIASLLPSLKFIAFTHSFPYFRPSVISPCALPHFTALPHTLYAYPTRSGISSLAIQYHVPEALCSVVYHPATKLYHPLVKEIHKRVNLFKPDILIVYPARLCPEKKHDKIICLAGALKLLSNKSIQIIFCDPVSDCQDDYMNAIKKTAADYGLMPSEIFFTSSLGYSSGIPHEAVLELLRLSDLFICPSLSESFSLTMLEAASSGAFIVYNQNVPALNELGQMIHGYPMDWDAQAGSFSIVQNYVPCENSYYGYHGSMILHLMKNNPVLYGRTKLRTRFNPEWIWYHQMAPLIAELSSI